MKAKLLKRIRKLYKLHDTGEEVYRILDLKNQQVLSPVYRGYVNNLDLYHAGILHMMILTLGIANYEKLSRQRIANRETRVTIKKFKKYHNESN
jgi:hypothetical protein